MPDTGGANIPALNTLLQSWDMALSSEVLEGEFSLADHSVNYASGTSIARWPREGYLVARDLNDQGKFSFLIFLTSNYVCECMECVCVHVCVCLCVCSTVRQYVGIHNLKSDANLIFYPKIGHLNGYNPWYDQKK